MKSNNLIIILFIVLISCGSEVHKKEVKKIECHIDKLTSMSFDRKYVNFGSVPQDTILKARYNFYNTGKEILYIKYINPDCTCTSYVLSKDSIVPRDSAFIELLFDTKHKFGKNKIYTIVCTNTNARLYKLTFNAFVK